MTKITLEGEYQTRDGRPVRVLCVDGKGLYPVVALIDDDGNDVVRTFTADGQFWCAGYECYNLIPVPKRHKRTVWVNLYPEGGCAAYPSKPTADFGEGSDRIACLKLDLDFVEGEGL